MQCGSVMGYNPSVTLSSNFHLISGSFLQGYRCFLKKTLQFQLLYHLIGCFVIFLVQNTNFQLPWYTLYGAAMLEIVIFVAGMLCLVLPKR